MPSGISAIARLAGSFLVVLGFLLAGTLLVRLAGLPTPGSVVGMVLLAAALRLRLLPLAAVRPAAELLLRHMALFFVPPGVGLMLYPEMLRAEWPALVGGAAVGALAVLLAVGMIQQRMEPRG